jgi:hypothetical protein
MDMSASERITIPEMIDAITTTLANARLEGEPYKSKAEEHLAPIEAILARIGLDKRDVDSATRGIEAENKDLDRRAEALVLEHTDEIWTQLGCPDYDPIYNILFPYTAFDNIQIRAKAERLSLLADLLSSNVHPKIDRVYAARAALEIRSVASDYQKNIYFLSQHEFKMNALQAFEASVARVGLLELGTLRKSFRGMGIDDSLVKSIVPPPMSTRRVWAEKHLITSEMVSAREHEPSRVFRENADAGSRRLQALPCAGS